MTEIKRPRHHDFYADRDIDCQAAADISFRELWGNIAAAGWSAEEIAAAIYELTDNHLTSLRLLEETEQEIGDLKRKRGQ